MRRYFCLVATLAFMIPGLARAQFRITTPVGVAPAATSATSSRTAFEFNDVAYGNQVQPVPEPTTRALIACGMGIGFLVLNRKHAKKS
jgi:hypothetical protein